MTQKQHLLLGAHTSIADGLEQAIIRGASINCSTIQIFTKSNRQWAARELTQEQITLFKETRKSHEINPILVHATYLINVAATDKEIHHKSQKALEQEVERCELLGIDWLVLHPGSRGQSSEQEAVERIAESLNKVLENTHKAHILLELMAGQGSSIGNSFEQLAAIYEKVDHENKKRIGYCLDTCHAFAAGYDFRTEDTYAAMWQKFDHILGLNKLHAIHLNDSKKDLGSRIDRHESIGKGKLGLKPFELLFNDERFFDVPKILETPEGTLEDYAKDMKTIMDLLSEKTKKKLGIE